MPTPSTTKTCRRRSGTFRSLAAIRCKSPERRGLCILGASRFRVSSKTMAEQVAETNYMSLLREAGLRSTPQRLAVVREVFRRNHPTASEVFETVRQQFPTIGLATVYNTLRSLTERGYVRELPFGDATRFDVNVTTHANLVCNRCGRIED